MSLTWTGNSIAPWTNWSACNGSAVGKEFPRRSNVNLGRRCQAFFAKQSREVLCFQPDYQKPSEEHGSPVRCGFVYAYFVRHTITIGLLGSAASRCVLAWRQMQSALLSFRLVTAQPFTAMSPAWAGPCFG
jgi:hypothetical protein